MGYNRQTSTYKFQPYKVYSKEEYLCRKTSIHFIPTIIHTANFLADINKIIENFWELFPRSYPVISVKVLLPDNITVKYRERFPLNHKIIIGRSSGSSIKLKNSRISSRHIELGFSTKHGLYFKDLNSKNGTFLNRMKIKPLRMYSLKESDVLAIANLNLSVRIESIPVKRPIVKIIAIDKKIMDGGEWFELQTDQIAIVEALLIKSQQSVYFTIDIEFLFQLIKWAIGFTGFHYSPGINAGYIEDGIIKFLMLRFFTQINLQILNSTDEKICFRRLIWEVATIDKYKHEHNCLVAYKLSVRSKRKVYVFEIALPVHHQNHDFDLQSTDNLFNIIIKNRLSYLCDIKMKVVIEYGEILLTVDEFKNISIGDMILFKKENFDLDTISGIGMGSVRLKLKNSALNIAARITDQDGKKILLINEIFGEKFMENERKKSKTIKNGKCEAENMDDSNGKINEDVANNVTIPLTVELHRIYLPLKQILQFRKGQLIPLDIKELKDLILSAGDRAIARCKLIKIDDHIGIEILEFYNDEKFSPG